MKKQLRKIYLIKLKYENKYLSLKDNLYNTKDVCFSKFNKNTTIYSRRKDAEEDIFNIRLSEHRVEIHSVSIPYSWFNV